MNIMETEDGNVLVSIPIRFQTVCGRRRLVVVGQGEVNDIDLDESGTLIRLFARAREWTRLLESGAFADVKELAEGLKMDRPYVVRVLRLANLSPKILRAVIAKELPDDSLFRNRLVFKHISCFYNSLQSSPSCVLESWLTKHILVPFLMPCPT